MSLFGMPAGGTREPKASESRAARPEDVKPLSLFSGVVGGGAGGLLGAFSAHELVTLLNRFGAETWLKGPYGPPFFDVALDMGVLFLGIAVGVARKPKAALIALLGPFVIIAAPMAALTRAMRWGLDGRPTLAWVFAVGGLYIAATWGTLLVLGASLSRGPRWAGALGGAAGAFAGYLLLAGLLKFVPSYSQALWSPTGLIPSPMALLNGLLMGAGFGAGVYLSGRNHESQASVG